MVLLDSHLSVDAYVARPAGLLKDRIGPLSCRAIRREMMKTNTFPFQTLRRTPKVLMVVAHPDDEYTFAATSCRIVQEMGGHVDQVVITDGAGGHRYSHAAESIYGLQLTDPVVA